MNNKINAQDQRIKQLEENTLRNMVKVIPLNSLIHSKYDLTTPLYITIEYNDENEVIASLNEVEAFVIADTEYEAIQMLREEIVQLYEDLSSDPDSLGPLPQKWLLYLNGVIRDSKKN